MTDKGTVRIVVIALAFIALVLVVGYVWLLRDMLHQAAALGPIDPSAIAAIAAIGPLVGAAVSQLGALLSSMRTNDSPQEVSVVNPPGDPVNVEAGHFDLTFVIVVVAISLIVSILVGVWLFELDV